MHKLLFVLTAGFLTLLALPATPAVAQASTGTVTVVHGVPDLVVDVYVNGDLTLEDFAPNTVTDPLTLPAGNYDLAGLPVRRSTPPRPSAVRPRFRLAPTPASSPTSTPRAADAFRLRERRVDDRRGPSTSHRQATAAAPAVDVLANGAAASPT